MNGQVLSPADLKQLVAANPRTRLLDVRTPGEYESAHISGAYNVPLDSLSEHAAEIRAHVEDPVVLVCQSGMRARRAEEALKRAGMPNLHVLEGGLNGWVATGESVRRGPKRMSLERQVRITAGTLVALGGILVLTTSPLFALVPALVGGGLVMAGVTDSCLMGTALGKLPYNRPASCDVDAMVRALKAGTEPVPARRPSGGTAGSACNAG